MQLSVCHRPTNGALEHVTWIMYLLASIPKGLSSIFQLTAHKTYLEMPHHCFASTVGRVMRIISSQRLEAFSRSAGKSSRDEVFEPVFGTAVPASIPIPTA